MENSCLSIQKTEVEPVHYQVFPTKAKVSVELFQRALNWERFGAEWQHLDSPAGNSEVRKVNQDSWSVEAGSLKRTRVKTGDPAFFQSFVELRESD